MMRVIKMMLLLFTGMIGCFEIRGMQSPAEEQNTVQFTVMVIPYAKEGEDVKSLIQADPNRRIAASVVKTEFDKRGFTTYNYEELVNNLKTQDILDADNQTSLEQEIIKNSPSDIVLKVDYIQTKDANGNMVEILLEAIDSFTGQSLANGRGRSRIMNTDKFTLLSEQAAVESIGDFLDLLNSKFAAMHEKGRSIQLNFLLSEDAEYNMDSRVGEKSTPLKFIIRKWLREQSFKGYYHIKGGSQTSLSVDDFRIPVKDENGNNYQIDQFEEAVFFFFDDMGMSVTTSFRGANMDIAIN